MKVVLVGGPLAGKVVDWLQEGPSYMRWMRFSVKTPMPNADELASKLKLDGRASIMTIRQHSYRLEHFHIDGNEMYIGVDPAMTVLEAFNELLAHYSASNKVLL